MKLTITHGSDVIYVNPCMRKTRTGMFHDANRPGRAGAAGYMRVAPECKAGSDAPVSDRCTYNGSLQYWPRGEGTVCGTVEAATLWREMSERISQLLDHPMASLAGMHIFHMTVPADVLCMLLYGEYDHSRYTFAAGCVVALSRKSGVRLISAGYPTDGPMGFYDFTDESHTEFIPEFHPSIPYNVMIYLSRCGNTARDSPVDAILNYVDACLTPIGQVSAVCVGQVIRKDIRRRFEDHCTPGNERVALVYPVASELQCSQLSASLSLRSTIDPDEFNERHNRTLHLLMHTSRVMTAWGLRGEVKAYLDRGHSDIEGNRWPGLLREARQEGVRLLDIMANLISVHKSDFHAG